MYNILLAEQIFSIAIIVAGVLLLFRCRPTKLQLRMEVLLMGLLFNQAGYLLEMTAGSLELAMSGVKIEYIGKLTAELLTFLFVMESCNRRVPGWLSHALIDLHIFVMVLVWNYERIDWYYSDVAFTTEGLFPHLVLGKGIVYHLFTVLTFVYMAIMMIVCMQSMLRARERVEKGKIGCLMTIPLLSVISLLILKLVPLQGYDVTTLAYTFDTLLLIYAILRYNLTDPEELAKDTIVDEFPDAVLVLGQERKVHYANQAARRLFHLNIDETKAEIQEELLEMLKERDTVRMEERVFRVKQMSVDRHSWNSYKVFVLSDATENYNYTRMLEERSRIDELTHTQNRRALIGALEKDLEEEKTFVVLMDIDNFKSVNDTYGHDVGDECLILLGATLQDEFSFEEVYRFGGDEFVIISQRKDLYERLVRVNERLTSGENPYPFSISGGYVKYRKGMDDKSIIVVADRALYKKKRGGKGGFVMLQG